MSRLEDEMRAHFGQRLKISEPIAPFTSFRIGGPADLMVEAGDENELMLAMGAAYREGVRAFCLGAGTNLLVSDRGIRGIVIRLGGEFGKVTVDDVNVSAGAAVDFRGLVASMVDRGLEGLEFAEGIPGTVGGGLVMNAGAFGGEISSVVRSVRGVTIEGRARTLEPQEVGFAYRRTNLPAGFVISRVDFELRHGDREKLLAHVGDIHAKRMARQPRDVPNAGSIFKNPPGSFAGRLLEAAGVKGEWIGDAAFSDRHANFIVNLGAARADDVRALMESARLKVKENTGIWLEPEVKLVGEW